MRLNFILYMVLLNSGLFPSLLQVSAILKTVNDYQIVIERQQASTYCNTSWLSNASVTWFKENNPNEVVSRNPNLTFANISRADGGRYICNATGIFQIRSIFFNQSTFFNVTYPPENLTIINKGIFLEFTSVTLRCTATGNPIPEIWFTRDGKRAQSTQVIEFPSIHRNDSGNYTCIASNGVGNNSERTAIDVQYPPKILQMPKVRSSWLNDVVELVCEASGNPVPALTWRPPGAEPLNSSVISFNVTNETQFGFYSCVASNKVGNESFAVLLNRTRFPPDPPLITNNITTITSRNFTLKWTKPDERNSKITCYWVWRTSVFHNGSMEGWERFKHDVLQPLNLSFFLDWGMSYLFAVSAENGQGTSSKGPHKNITVIAEPKDRPTKSTFGIVMFIVGGVLALVIIIAIAVVCYKRRSRQPPPPCPKPDLKEDHHRNISMKEITSRLSRKGSKERRYSTKHPPFNEKESSFDDDDDDDDEGPDYENAPNMKAPEHAAIYDNLACVDKAAQDWELQREKVKIEKIIGKGAFCQVAKGFVEGLGTVAIKMIRDTCGKDSSNRKDLLAEYKLLQHLGTHDNVVLVLGGVTLTDPIMIIFEYVPYGDLLGYLRRSRGLNDTYYNDPDERPSSSLTSQQLMRFSREVADGMAFLSGKKIVHRDLAARNVLVCQGETCKITDFGMARDVTNEEIYRKRTRGRLPVKWTAYEALLFGFYTTQSDVWSYGIVLYEIFTIGGSPYPDQDGRRLAMVIQTGYRMPKPKHVDNEIYALMSECWRTEPERRPTFDTIAKTLRRLERHRKDYIFMNQYEQKLYANLDDL